MLPAILLVLAAAAAGCGGDGSGKPQNAEGRGSAGKSGAGRTSRQDYLSLTFSFLGAFPVPDPGEGAAAPGSAGGPAEAKARIPREILDLSGRKVAIQGYMVPVDYEQEGTNRFVLLGCTLACCYGKMPRVNEWIDVTVDGGRRVRYLADRPVWVFGNLEVKEDIEGGNLVGLYSLLAEEITGPDDL